MSATVGSFTLLLNEREWIAAHLLSWLPVLDEMIFYSDAASNDGTVGIIKDFQRRHELGGKIKLFENKTPKNLQDSYVELFDACMRELSTDYAAFLHPDFLPDGDASAIRNLGKSTAYFSSIRSFAGEPGGKLFEFTEGRTDKWLHIYRLNNPDLGAKYHGHYGASNEGVYFEAITGDEHILYKNMDLYPFPVGNSGLNIMHFSDVRPYGRRIDRMVKCLMNQIPGMKRQDAYDLAKHHPRVSLESAENYFGKFKLIPATYPPIFDVAKRYMEAPCIS